MAGIGSVVRQGTEGLVVYPPEEITQPQYHLQELEKQTDKTIVLKGYEFTPDAVYTKDPVPIHIIQKAAEIKAAKQTRWLADKNLLSIGAAIICPDSKLCYTIASHTLKTVYQYISPLETQVDVQP